MFSLKINKDRLMVGAIVVVSMVGIFYFGIRTIRDHAKRNQKNLDNYKQTNAELHHYFEVKKIPILFSVMRGITIDREDCLYVSGDGSYSKFSPEGHLQLTVSTGQTARCLAVDANGDVVLGLDDHIEVYTRAGKRKAQWDFLSDDAIITSIALTADHVFAADAGNRIVWKLDKEGQPLGKIGEKNKSKDIPGFVIPSPYFDVVVDPDGFLWAVNSGRHSLENYTVDGDLRASWGHFSLEVDGFCGCCNPSHMAILEDGSFITSEKGIPRVKQYNRLGDIVSVIAGPLQFREGTVGLDLAVDSHQRIYVLDPPRGMVRIFEKNIN